ncbi:MAG: recombinase family protein [Candidatus Nezhaarchaeales archaeon]
MKAVIYSRVSTEEQDPKSQLTVVLDYAKERGYEIVRVFEEKISGSVDPLERPVFNELIRFVRRNDIQIILMYDLTRFYRAKSPTEALNRLRRIMEEHNVLIDFAREPEIEDPLMRELWLFIKSWFSSYERLQASLRTRYGIARLKNEGKLYHKPTIVHYYAAWLYDKDFTELTKEELERARRQLIAIVKKYFKNPAYKRTQVGSLLAKNELREMYIRFPKAPKSYITFYRLMRGEGFFQAKKARSDH